jgi:uncharacterized protein
MQRRRLVWCLALWLLAAGIGTLSALNVPQLVGRVNDYAGILKPEEKTELEAYLASVESKTTAQLVLLTIKSLEGDPLEDFSIRVAEAWKIGQKGKDNGLILLVSLNERAVRIEVGYGLEGVLPDGKCGTIIRQQIVPEFRGGNYYAGIKNAFQTLAQVAGGDSTGLQALENQDKSKGRSSGGFNCAFFFILIIIAIVIKMLSPCKALRSMSGKSGGWTSHSSGGFFSGGGSRSSGGGGFSGGGGSFGGGGASGGW